MRALGDKIGSKLIAEDVGVPVAPWSRGGVDTLTDALEAADKVGYPLMLKATAGGGGRGIRMVASADDLADAYQRTRDEAERAFGSGVVFLERLVTGARHVEVQVIADAHGTAWALGVRDCSVQRRNQKIIEESVLTPARRGADGRAEGVRRAARPGGGVRRSRHRGVPLPPRGALVRVPGGQHPPPGGAPDHGVDHRGRPRQGPAAGRVRGALVGERPTESGHAVEARLNAEDPDRDFAPSPGRISLLELPSGPGVRVDTGVGEGDTIPADFDSMIAKIIAVGSTRTEALARLRRAVSETTVVIEGGATNKSFVLDLLAQPEVVDGGGDGWADTGWIDRVRGQGRLHSHRHSGVALVAAGISAYEDAERHEVEHLLETARGGRPNAQHEVGRGVELKLRGASYTVTVLRVGLHRFRVSIGHGEQVRVVEATVSRIDDFHVQLTVDGQRFRLVTATHGPVQLVEVDGVSHRVTRDEGGMLRSPAPALVVATPVAVGDEVAAGALGHRAGEHEDGDRAARAVRRAHARAPGQDGQPGRDRRAPAAARAGARRRRRRRRAAPDGPDLELPSRPPTARRTSSSRPGAAAARAILLGYDTDPDTEAATLSAYLAAREQARAERARRGRGRDRAAAACSPTSPS